MPRILIAGCGFVGTAASHLFASAGWDVVACTHSRESACAFVGQEFPVIACDISDRAAVARLADRGGFDAVVHCASSGRGGVDAYRRVYLNGVRNLAEVLAPRKLLFASSTSVYAQTDGGWVTEVSDARPARDTGQVLREAEAVVLAGDGVVARLAGIYGPGRSVLLKKFIEGAAVIEGDGGRWINQVHRDDIATALLLLLETGTTGIFNVTDDVPLQQRAIYEWLAHRFDRPLPPSGPIDPGRKRGWTDKRVSNAKLRALGWAPQFPSFFDAVDKDAALAGLTGA